mgnify:CR=1 FL=1
MILEEERTAMEKKIAPYIIKLIDDNGDDSESDADDETSMLRNRACEEDDVLDVDTESAEYEKSIRYEPFKAELDSLEATQRRRTPLAMERAKQKLGAMALLNGLLFVMTHSFFSLFTLMQQLINFVYGPINIFIGFNYYAYLSCLNEFANMIIYASFALNFLIYFSFNDKFKYTLNRAFRKFLAKCCSCCFYYIKVKHR